MTSHRPGLVAGTHGPSRFLAGWTLRCAAAEAIGMTAASVAAKASQALTGQSASTADRLAALAAVIAGGLVEGVALGALQAAGLGRLLPGLDRRRWLWLTLVVAGLGWGVASAPAALFGGGSDPAGPPLAVMLVGAAGLGLAMGCLLGAVQSRCLHGLVGHPNHWTAISTAAWCPVMAVIFLGASAPAADWAVFRVAALGALTGSAAGAILGLVTGLLLPALGDLPAARSTAATPATHQLGHGIKQGSWLLAGAPAPREGWQR